MSCAYQFGNYIVRCKKGSRLQKLCAELKEEFPKLKIRRKRHVWYHWLAHITIMVFTLFMQRKYIKNYTTTGEDRIDLSDKHHERLESTNAYFHDRVWETLTHERIHLRQFRDRNILWSILIWAFPPVAFCYGRCHKTERPAYLQSIRSKFEYNREYCESADYRKWWVKQFTSSAYGWMWVLKKQVESWFDEELKKLQQAAAIKV